MSDFQSDVNNFLNEARSKGYELQASQIRFDGELVRFPIGKSKDAGWVIAYDNPQPCGKKRPVFVFGDWKTGEKHKFVSGGWNSLNKEEQERTEKYLAERRKELKQKQESSHEATAIEAKRRWDEASNGATADSHPYLIRKGLSKSYGARLDQRGNLIVPMGNEQGLCGLQTITPEGEKFFMKGQKFKGSHIIIGEKSNDEMYLCEGYATGATIYETTGRATIVGFSSGNLPEVARLFKGHKIIVCGDDDRFTEREGKENAGKKCAHKAAKILDTIAVFPPFTEQDDDGTDFNDYFLKHGSEKLRDFFANVREQQECEFTNFDTEEYEDKKGNIKIKKIAKTAEKMWKELKALAGQKIKRIDRQVFTISKNDEILFHAKADSFHAWLMGQRIHPNFAAVSGAVNKAEFLNYLGQQAHNYAYMSKAPQFPIRDDIYCPNQIMPIATGKLNELLDFFSTKDDAHRDLLRAAFCTPFWSGDGGTRPAFVFDGVDGDGQKNRGISKTTVSEVISTLAGGYIDLSSKAEIDEIKKRMLTSEFRIGRFDNIKTLKLSSEALESLITTQWISGHKMYVGDVRVPNIFTYMLTFNGASFSKDMAQRCVIVRLRRPNKTNDWLYKVNKFIDDHKTQILADIGFILTRPIELLPSKTRFPSWECGVMQRCGGPEAIDVLVEEQSAADDDEKLCDEIFELFSAKIAEYKKNLGDCLNPIENSVLIKRGVAAQWMTDVLGKINMRMATRILAQNLPQIIQPKTIMRMGYEYWVWDVARAGQKIIREGQTASFFVIDRLTAHETVGIAQVDKNRLDTCKTPEGHLNNLQ